MSEEAPLTSAPVVVPRRPSLADRPLDLVGDRLRALRSDPRVGAALLVLLAVGAGVFWYRSASAPPAAPAEEAAGAQGSEGATGASGVAGEPSASTTTSPGVVVVHVAGAVARPGVVALPGGSRVIDAVEAAGGPQPDADLDRLNLAAPVADGDRVAVARQDEPAPPLDATAPGGPDPAGEAGAAAAGAPLDLNVASAAELEALPGIGPTLAAAIVEERERRGGFTSVDQLQQVPGIGEQRYARLRDLVTV